LRHHSDAGHESRRQTAKDRTYATLPRKNLSFTGRRKSKSPSRGRFKKHNIPVQQDKWQSSHKAEGYESPKNGGTWKESAPTAKSDVAKDMQMETRGKPLTNYSSSDDDKKVKTLQNRVNIAQKSSTEVRKEADDKRMPSGRRSDTALTAAAGGHVKDVDNSKTKNDDKPKETLEDMEMFLKQLKANKQQQMQKK